MPRAKSKALYKYQGRDIVPANEADGWLIEYQEDKPYYKVTFNKREADKMRRHANVRVRSFNFDGPWDKKPMRRVIDAR